MVGSLSSGSSGPRPRSSSRTSATSCLRSTWLSAWFCLASSSATMSPTSASICCARHLVERLQVDEVEQPLVKLDLEVGMHVALGESAGVADRDQPMLFERLLELLGRRRPAPRAGLRTCHILSDPGRGRRQVPAATVSRSLASALFRLSSSERHPAVDCRAHQREIVADGVGNVAAQGFAHIGRPDRARQALFVAIDDDPDLEPAQILRIRAG